MVAVFTFCLTQGKKQLAVFYHMATSVWHPLQPNTWVNYPACAHTELAVHEPYKSATYSLFFSDSSVH